MKKQTDEERFSLTTFKKEIIFSFILVFTPIYLLVPRGHFYWGIIAWFTFANYFEPFCLHHPEKAEILMKKLDWLIFIGLIYLFINWFPWKDGFYDFMKDRDDIENGEDSNIFIRNIVAYLYWLFVLYGLNYLADRFFPSISKAFVLAYDNILLFSAAFGWILVCWPNSFRQVWAIIIILALYIYYLAQSIIKISNK